jgi:predicted enzyme related to lactoylglutathione lyase
MAELFSKIHSTSVCVADQETALDFYINTLEWKVGMDMPMGESDRWLTVVPPGGMTQLALVPKSWFPDPAHAPGNTGISLISPDIDAAYETLTARGVKFKGPVEMMPWGSKATWFYDLDGNEFFLVAEQGTSES